VLQCQVLEAMSAVGRLGIEAAVVEIEWFVFETQTVPGFVCQRIVVFRSLAGHFHHSAVCWE
jgi:hypothetical protein